MKLKSCDRSMRYHLEKQKKFYKYLMTKYEIKVIVWSKHFCSQIFTRVHKDLCNLVHACPLAYHGHAHWTHSALNTLDSSGFFQHSNSSWPRDIYTYLFFCLEHSSPIIIEKRYWNLCLNVDSSVSPFSYISFYFSIFGSIIF